ncbi:leucine-rich repeat receptor-like serine/threonine-protein kinase BAM3 isoform X1 [Canna indica]|uniref:Leucine-rich repeat receptor-like serine/threonine-protein kinase BAM3 isoform X1 n=1 Tax=Canna indica TaxID=4628 RepID=A0AAQ3KN06_9LILI|nr:leucine-rich repeat receptor-like serine/threonine-protein kinase BAM3 isoform X1 [Canna indica]
MAALLGARLLFCFSCSLLLFALPSSSSTPSSFHGLSLRKQASILVSIGQSFRTSDPFFPSWTLLNHAALCSWNGVRCDETKRAVVELELPNMNISGVLCPKIAELKSIASISIPGNSFSGEFPSSVSALSGLKLLNISNNHFNGTLEWNFSRMVGLEVLDAYNNDFFGSLHVALSELPTLCHLDLGGNYFNDTIPAEYSEFRAISYLSLSRPGPEPETRRQPEHRAAEGKATNPNHKS